MGVEEDRPHPVQTPAPGDLVHGWRRHPAVGSGEAAELDDGVRVGRPDGAQPRFATVQIPQREAGRGLTQRRGLPRRPPPRWCRRADPAAENSRWIHGAVIGPTFVQSRGFTRTPWTRIPQCRCGPVLRPVDPTRPTTSPLCTRRPGRTVMAERCWYVVKIPAPWSRTTVLPLSGSSSARGTNPRCAARTGVPAEARKSTPRW